MYIADSNILIYSYLEEYEYLRDVLFNDLVYVSEISRVEVLGYHKISFDEEIYFEDLFKSIPIINPTQEIFNKAIQLRRAYNLKLGDGLIAATALVNDLIIYTRNVSDFERVEQLKYINPLRK